MKKLLYILLFVPMFGFCQIIFNSSQGEYNSDSSVFTFNNIYSDLIYPLHDQDAIRLNTTFDNNDYSYGDGCLDNSNEFCFITSYSINFEILPPGFDTWYYDGSMPTQNFDSEYGGSITFFGSTPYIGQYNINYTIDLGVEIQGTGYEITLPYSGGNSIIDEAISYNYDLINMDLPELVMNIEYGNPILGCPNINYVEYNPLANVDDGSCQTSINSLYLYSLIDSLSNQVQNLQESLSSVIEAEEVVSDANSFDVLNPLSYNGEFEVIQHDFVNGEYIVPNGKTLLIKTIHSVGNSSDNMVLIEGAELAHVGNQAQYGFVNDVVVGANKSINSFNSYWETPGVNSNTTFTGVLIDRSIETIHHAFTGQEFTVPPGKTLVINQILLNSASSEQELYVNEVPLFELAGITLEFSMRNNLFVGENQSIGSNYNSSFSFHGYLIDNSNYTYTTDYELIEALNEGMDSLSTMSEMVVLENYSISSQNAILSQENEALMAIDYNFDSLQYVADFLSSQVFELQQELLVPNIDVDMAIGWNMIGFSCPEVNSAENALNDIVEELIILKDNNGLVYLPEWNFNGIGDLTPGHGYQLKVTDYILDFNICD